MNSHGLWLKWNQSLFWMPEGGWKLSLCSITCQLHIVWLQCFLFPRLVLLHLPPLFWSVIFIFELACFGILLLLTCFLVLYYFPPFTCFILSNVPSFFSFWYFFLNSQVFNFSFWILKLEVNMLEIRWHVKAELKSNSLNGSSWNWSYQYGKMMFLV